MNFRQKSKVKGKWAFIKYPADMAIYAVCQNCGLTYEASKMPRDEEGKLILRPEPSLEKLYRYCPNCGLKMRPFNGDYVYKYSDLVNKDE